MKHRPASPQRPAPAPPPAEPRSSAAAPTLVVTMRPIDSLIPDPLNARVHTDHQVQQIANSIEAFTFNAPLLIDRYGRVIAGHGRLAACRLLGRTHVPTIMLEHLSETQVQAYRIADNALTDASTWDERLLAGQLQSLAAVDLDFSLEAIGFDLPEIDLRIQGLADGDGEEPEDVELPTADAVAISTLGDLWELGSHRILCNDALDPGSYERVLAGRKARLIFTDPPFDLKIGGHVSGNGAIKHREFPMASGEMDEAEFTQFLMRACDLMAQHSVPGSLHYLFMDWRHLKELLAAGSAIYDELKNICVWVKTNAGMGSFYRSQHEFVLVFKLGTAPHVNNIQLGQYGRYRSNVWQYAGMNSFARTTEEGNLLAAHPTVKPLKLVADALMDASHRRDVVLDPFLGSGTTVIAAEATGRVASGIELDPLYVDTAIRRWQRRTGLSARHAETGQTFDEIEAEVNKATDAGGAA